MCVAHALRALTSGGWVHHVLGVIGAPVQCSVFIFHKPDRVTFSEAVQEGVS